MKKGKKTKKMAIGGIGSALGATAAKAVAAKKPMGLGEGIARAAGVPVGGLRPTNPGASNLVIDNKPPPLLGLRPTPPMPAKPVGPGIKPTVTGAPATPITPKPMGGLNQAMSNLGIKKGTGPMIGQRFGGMKKGGKVSSASKRADGIAQRGKTKGKMV